MHWLCHGRVSAPQTLPRLRPSIPAQLERLFGEGSLKALAEKNLVSSPPSPRGGGLVVDPHFAINTMHPLACSARAEPPTRALGSPHGGYVPAAIAASCDGFDG